MTLVCFTLRLIASTCELVAVHCAPYSHWDQPLPRPGAACCAVDVMIHIRYQSFMQACQRCVVHMHTETFALAEADDEIGHSMY